MLAIGQSSWFIGEVAVFPDKQSLERFEAALRKALSGTTSGNSDTWEVHVKVHILGRPEIVRFATEMNTQPTTSAAVAFLNGGAVHACKEFGIEFLKSDDPNRSLPPWATPTIDTKYRSKQIFAGPA